MAGGKYRKRAPSADEHKGVGLDLAVLEDII
jgi:hypothetical protein